MNREMIDRIQNYGNKFTIESTTDGYYASISNCDDIAILWTEKDSYFECIHALDLKIRMEKK